MNASHLALRLSHSATLSCWLGCPASRLERNLDSPWRHLGDVEGVSLLRSEPLLSAPQYPP